MPHNYAIEKQVLMKKLNHMATFVPPRSLLTHLPTAPHLVIDFPSPAASSILFLAVNFPPYQLLRFVPLPLLPQTFPLKSSLPKRFGLATLEHAHRVAL